MQRSLSGLPFVLSGSDTPATETEKRAIKPRAESFRDFIQASTLAGRSSGNPQRLGLDAVRRAAADVGKRTPGRGELRCTQHVKPSVTADVAVALERHEGQVADRHAVATVSSD